MASSSAHERDVHLHGLAELRHDSGTSQFNTDLHLPRRGADSDSDSDDSHAVAVQRITFAALLASPATSAGSVATVPLVCSVAPTSPSSHSNNPLSPLPLGHSPDTGCRGAAASATTTLFGLKLEEVCDVDCPDSPIELLPHTSKSCPDLHASVLAHIFPDFTFSKPAPPVSCDLHPGGGIGTPSQRRRAARASMQLPPKASWSPKLHGLVAASSPQLALSPSGAHMMMAAVAAPGGDRSSSDTLDRHGGASYLDDTGGAPDGGGSAAIAAAAAARQSLRALQLSSRAPQQRCAVSQKSFQMLTGRSFRGPSRSGQGSDSGSASPPGGTGRSGGTPGAAGVTSSAGQVMRAGGTQDVSPPSASRLAGGRSVRQLSSGSSRHRLMQTVSARSMLVGQTMGCGTSSAGRSDQAHKLERIGGHPLDSEDDEG